MKAIVQQAYGSLDVLKLCDVECPPVGESDVLVRARAASVHPDVWHVVRGRPYVLRLMGAGLRRPRVPIPGTDVAGIVEAVGKNVTRFMVGDEVFGECVRGRPWQNGGAFAQYVSVSERSLALKPTRLSFAQAAAAPSSGFIALQGLLEEGQLKAGQEVLINGAGGGVGNLAVQIARAYGACVTGVDAADKHDMLRSIGAERVLDFASEDFTKRGELYDLIMDVPGNHSLSECRRVLKPQGIYVLIGHDQFGAAAGPLLGSLARFKKLMGLSALIPQLTWQRRMKKNEERLIILRDLMESGKLTPIIERTYPLAEAGEAISHLQRGNVRGKIVLVM